jgi:hypothetical protein
LEPETIPRQVLSALLRHDNRRLLCITKLGVTCHTPFRRESAALPGAGPMALELAISESGPYLQLTSAANAVALALGLLAYVLTLFSSVALPHSDASQPFSLTLHEPKAPARVGSEIHLTVTVANTSNHDVSFGVAPGIAPDQTMSYNIEIRGAQGREAPPTPFLRDLREHPKPTSGSIFGYTLAPGESYVGNHETV